MDEQCVIFNLSPYLSTNMTSSIFTMTFSDTHQTRMNGGSSFLLRVQAHGLLMPSLGLPAEVASFFFLVRVASPSIPGVHFLPRR